MNVDKPIMILKECGQRGGDPFAEGACRTAGELTVKVTVLKRNEPLARSDSGFVDTGKDRNDAVQLFIRAELLGQIPERSRSGHFISMQSSGQQDAGAFLPSAKQPHAA